MIYQVGHRAQCGKCFLASLGPTCSSKDIRENELMNLYLFMAKKRRSLFLYQFEPNPSHIIRIPRVPPNTDTSLGWLAELADSADQ